MTFPVKGQGGIDISPTALVYLVTDVVCLQHYLMLYF
jgi:hypothetical protein